MRTIATALVLLLVTLFGAGCAEEAGATAGQAELAGEANGRESWPAQVRFGLVPSEGGTDIVERFAPMLVFLEQELGVEVVASSATEYVGIITAMRNDQLDFAYLGPKSYIEAERLANAEAIIKELNPDGTAGYHGLLVARADSDIATIADARGVTLAFVAPNSTSGFLVPTLGIHRETGETPEAYFGQIRYTGSHGSSVQAVLRGDVDIAATNDLDLNAMAKAGLLDATRLRVIWKSELIPGAPIAARRELPESLRSAFRDAVLKFSQARRDAVEDMGRAGFVVATDEDYDVVRLLEQRRAELAGDGG